MRLHRLDLEGFGPFRERQVVDFDAFAGDGIFLISGRTGAGKSSILDGVCFALYGDVPRYSGSEKRLRSDHCAPDDATEVQLEFSLGDRRLRVTRSPEYSRPKRRGEGLTPVKQQAQLDEWADGGWVGLASGPRDVGLLLGEVLGLTREQFLQVILLAQGRFAQFLLAGNDERQAVLRTLFGTRRYEDYAKALAERRKAAIEGVGEAQRTLEVLLDYAERLAAEAGVGLPEPGTPEDGTDVSGLQQSDLQKADASETPQPVTVKAGPDGGSAGAAGRLESLARASGRARHRVETADADLVEAQTLRTRAETALADGKRTAQAQTELAAGRSALAHLEADAPAIADARAELERAAAAESLRATLEVDVRRGAELARAQQEEVAARAALAAAHFDAPDADETRLQAAIDEWIAQLSAWQEAEELERQLPERRRQLDALSAELAKTRTEREQVDAALAAAPARTAELDAAIAAAIELAGAEAGLAERIAADDARLIAARELETIGPRVVDAEAAYATAAQRAEEGGKAVVRLLQQRLRHHAAELAADLRPGEPCAVCGSPEHPQPAGPAPDAVTDEHIAAAERERDARRVAETAAQQAAREVREQRNGLAERSGGATVAHLEEGLIALRAQAAAAAEARVRRDALVAEREQLAAEVVAAGHARDALTDRITQLTTEHAKAAESVRAADAQVAEARGDAASVAERIAATSALRVAAAAALTAARALTVAQSAADDARADRDRGIDASGFDDADAATAALRDAQTHEQLAERIKTYDAQLAAHRARLLELELLVLPEAPVDLGALQARDEAADQAYRDAVARRARADALAGSLAELLAQAQTQRDLLGPLAAQADGIAALADAISGRGANTHRMTLEAFVLAAELEEIVAQANVRLDDMSSGRYRLQHTDARAARNGASGLGIEVMDAFTGVARPATSLSGGETFLASLALALGLADVVTARAGGIRLDTLFVDEGFGSLDSETLEIAMNTLESLRHGGRTVGVISHVEAMREQLPLQLRVAASAYGPSHIEQQAAVGAA